MKYGRKKLIAAIIAVLLAALILNAALTWGIIFDCGGGFQRSSTYAFEDILSEEQTASICLGGIFR